MDRCPELVDLEHFFGSPARSAYGNDAGGWYYDSLSFEYQSGAEHVLCKVEPAECTFTICRSLGRRLELDLAFQYVVSLDLEHSAGVALLIGHINHGGVEQLFKLTLAPVFSFRLGTELPSFR